MFDSPESASLWFDIFNGVLLLGALLVALGTWGTIRTAAVKERFSDERIVANEAETARAVADSDIAKEGAAKANENTAKIQLLLNEEIRKNAWRRLSKEQHDAVSEAVRMLLPMKVDMGFDGNDPEASVYAADLIKAFEDGGATVTPQPSAMFIGQLPVSGMIFSETKGFDSGPIQAALAHAKIPFTLNESFRGQPWASISLYVGHKPQPF